MYINVLSYMVARGLLLANLVPRFDPCGLANAVLVLASLRALASGVPIQKFQNSPG
jgi:hypothetical protein